MPAREESRARQTHHSQVGPARTSNALRAWYEALKLTHCHFLSRRLFRLHNRAGPIVKKHAGPVPSSSAFMALYSPVESGIVAHLPEETGTHGDGGRSVE